MRTTMLLTCAIMLAGCSAAPEDSEDNDTVVTPEGTTTLNVDLLALTPYHCENGHKPIHCGSGNLSFATALGNLYANYSVDGVALPNPYPIKGEARLTATIAYAGTPGSASVDVTLAVDDVSGVKWIGATNVTKTLEAGDSLDVVFGLEPTEGWPDGDWIFPRVVMGVDDEEWVESHLIFVMAKGGQ